MGWFSDSGYQYPTSDSYTQDLSGDTWNTLSSYKGPAQQWDEGNGYYNGQGVNIGNYQALTDGADKITGWRTAIGDDTYANYDSSGKYTGTQKFDSSLWSSIKSPLAFAAAMAAAGYGASLMGGGLGGTAAAAGPGSAGWGTDLGLESGLSAGGGSTASAGLNPMFDSLTQGGLYASDTATTPLMTTGQGTLSGMGAETAGGGLGGAATDSTGAILGNGAASYGGSGFSLGDIFGTARKVRAGTQLASGLYDMWAKNQMAKNQAARASAIDNMYAPGSPEYNALAQQLARADAATGRNSQIGVRATDLAARIAQMKMNAAGTSNTINNSALSNRYGMFNTAFGLAGLADKGGFNLSDLWT